MKSFVYTRLEDAAERVLLKGGQTLEITLVGVAVAAQRHQFPCVVAASSERLWVVKFQLVAEGVALVAALAAAVVV